MENRNESILDIAIEINNKNIKAHGTELQPEDRILLILGSKGVGKSSLINRLQDKDEVPKPTLALEYSFVRRAGKSLYKDVCHIWELGGGSLFSDLSHTPINSSGSLNRLTVILMLDLSSPHQLWFTLDHFITKLSQFLSQYASENGITEEITKSAWERLGGLHHHQDKSLIEPFPVPLLIIGGKYDLYQQFDLEDKKLICQTLRNVAHAYGATLMYYSSKDQVLVKRARDLLNQSAFGLPSANKTIVQDFLKPLFVLAGADSFQQIGVSPSGGLLVALQRWKHTFTTRFPQKESVVTIPEDPAKDANFAEPVIDSLVSQKNDELEKYQWEIDRRLRLKSMQD